MLNLKKLLRGCGTAAALIAVVGVTGCESMRRDTGDRTAGTALDDRNITESVEDELKREPVYKFTDVEVRTFQGVVQLSGFVSSEDQKSRAGELAQQVPGVTRVINNITLIPGSEGMQPTGRTNAVDRSTR